MSTKTFSGRVEQRSLDFAEALTRKEYGMSFGQYCSSVLIDSIRQSGVLPPLTESRGQSIDKKREAVAFIKGFSMQAKNPSIGELTDEGIKELIASRYE